MARTLRATRYGAADRSRVAVVGPWSGGLKVNEDEVLAEVRTVGAEEWEQATAEAERTRRELSQVAEGVEAAD